MGHSVHGTGVASAGGKEGCGLGIGRARTYLLREIMEDLLCTIFNFEFNDMAYVFVTLT